MSNVPKQFQEGSLEDEHILLNRMFTGKNSTVPICFYLFFCNHAQKSIKCQIPQRFSPLMFQLNSKTREQRQDIP